MMPMNTVTTTPNISQVDRSNSAITTNTKVTNDSNAPFQPQTQVNIESSIKDMLTILSKTVIGKEIPVQEMPAELQKLVNDILQNAFSLDNSLAQGLSNVLQGQKASVDQLNLLSKLLAQLSVEVSPDGLNNLSDTLKTFLVNIKLLDGYDGTILDSTSLNKLAIQLLDGKAIENMPEVLQALLTQNNQSSTIIQPQQSSDMNFLKQLIKQFMPSPQENQFVTYTKQSNKTFNTSQEVMNTMVKSDTAAPSNTTLNNNTNQTITNNTTNTNTNTATSNPNTTETSLSGKQNNHLQNNVPVAQDSANMKDNLLTKMPAANQTTMQESAKGEKPEVITKSQDGNLNLTSQNNSNNAGSIKNLNDTSQNTQNTVANHNSGENAQQNKMSLPMQNTAATMQIIKNLANQIMNTKNLSMEEFSLLKNFVNDKQQVLNESEVKNLQTLLKMSEENLPTIIRQAAIKRNLPDLPKLWSFVQLCDLAQIADLPANKLKNASKNISDFTFLLKESMQNENEVNGNQRSMSFMTPLYLGDNKHCYPTYIHIYNQTDEGRAVYEKQKETWFRICLLTENVGAVEMVFRLYEQSKLNLRVTFSDNEAVQSFNEYMPEIQEAFKEMPLDLTDVKVNVIGE